MSDTEICVHDQAPLISAKDADLGPVLPMEFLERFTVHSYRNAVRVLSTAATDDFRELIETLLTFEIPTQHMVEKGGNKTKIALAMEHLLHPKGWLETRIRGDMLIETTTQVPNTRTKSPKFDKKIDLYRIRNFIDGHKIDFIKNRVAFDLEWNSKDQTFDRDLYAMRAFYEAGIIDAGVLITRDSNMGPLFSEISSRVNIDRFASKYGASTTWMGKLLYRLDAGRGGGCPILAVGITPAVVTDFAKWKADNPVIRKAVNVTDLLSGDEEESDE